MNRLITYCTILLMLVAFSAKAQKKPLGYTIEGDEIVFVFNKKDYKRVSHDRLGEHSDFDDLDIECVVVSGEFNNWSRDQWYMNKIDDDHYELRKKIAHLSDAFSWEFKFVINNEYWAEPSSKNVNITPARSHDGKNYNTYNLRAYTGAYPDKDGNVRFRLKGYKNATNVILSGSFNRWDHEAFKMYKIEHGWEVVLQLRPAVYEYRFIVDGHWMEDPTNPDKVKNEFGEYNSRVDVKKQVKITLRAHNEAQKVTLLGSFNDWKDNDCVMKKDDKGNWYYSLILSGGKYHYKFKVDGKWILDPINPVKEYDGKGHINSVLMIK